LIYKYCVNNYPEIPTHDLKSAEWEGGLAVTPFNVVPCRSKSNRVTIFRSWIYI